MIDFPGEIERKRRGVGWAAPRVGPDYRYPGGQVVTSLIVMVLVVGLVCAVGAAVSLLRRPHREDLRVRPGAKTGFAVVRGGSGACDAA